MCVGGLPCTRPTFLRMTVSALLRWGLIRGEPSQDVGLAGRLASCHVCLAKRIARGVFQGLDTCIVVAQVVTWGSEPGFRGFQEIGRHWRAVTGGLIANQNRGWRRLN
eukprot:881115-Amorphochlora_amoeboformis.AAC.1